MRPNDSSHLLPVSSMLFNSSPNLRTPLPTNSTLVDIREAADTSVTALPTAPTPTQHKPSVWRRMLAKIKAAFESKDKVDEEKKDQSEAKELQISGPTDFHHRLTGGAQPLRFGEIARVEEESEWEDVEDTKRCGGK
jgi:hypothetical protein